LLIVDVKRVGIAEMSLTIFFSTVVVKSLVLETIRTVSGYV